MFQFQEVCNLVWTSSPTCQECQEQCQEPMEPLQYLLWCPVWTRQLAHSWYTTAWQQLEWAWQLGQLGPTSTACRQLWQLSPTTTHLPTSSTPQQVWSCHCNINARLKTALHQLKLINLHNPCGLDRFPWWIWFRCIHICISKRLWWDLCLWVVHSSKLYLFPSGTILNLRKELWKIWRYSQFEKYAKLYKLAAGYSGLAPQRFVSLARRDTSQIS